MKIFFVQFFCVFLPSLPNIWLCATPETAAHPSLWFSRQEHWSGLPFPSPGDLPNPGIELGSPVLQADSLPTELWGKPVLYTHKDFLECEVKWALESITTNKASGGGGIPVERFQILKDDAVKVLHSICQQIWKTQQWPQDWKRSVFIPIPKKGNAKECSNYLAIALISHASKVMLKILQSQGSATHEPWTSRCSSWF